MLKNKKLLIAAALATTALTGCNNFENSDNSVTINEPFADANYPAGPYTASTGFGGDISVTLTATSFTGFDTDGSYTVTSVDGTANHAIVCMQISPNSGSIISIFSGFSADTGSLNFGATTGITFCCGASLAGAPQFRTIDFN
jgi:predicted small secreted protein